MKEHGLMFWLLRFSFRILGDEGDVGEEGRMIR